jgi:hypothetical protein
MITRLEDSFRNYDFNNPTTASPNNVDWPVTLLFFNNANVAKVKWYGFSSPSEQFGRFDNGSGFVWDGDAGSKDVLCSASSDHHYRVYGRLYNTDWGYYVFATSHMDYNECNLFYSNWFGNPDATENDVASMAQRAGYSVQRDWRSFQNYEPYRVEGDHYWSNDGLATAINVP